MDVTYEERIKKACNILGISHDDLFESMSSLVNTLSKIFQSVFNNIKEIISNIEFTEKIKYKPALEINPNKILIIDKRVRCYHLKSNC